MNVDRIEQFALNVSRWKATSELSFELADVMHSLIVVIDDYCKKNNVALLKNEAICSLLKKTRAILKDIENVNSEQFAKLLSDGSYHDDESDKKLPEPCIESLLGS